MSAGDDLLLRGAGGKLQNTDSVFRDQGQERAEGNFAVAEGKVVLVGAAAIMDVGAKHARFAQGEGLGVIMPGEKFLDLGMAKIVPVTDDLGRISGEDERKFLLVGKFLEVLPDFEAEADFQFTGELDDRVEAGLDAGPEDFETFLALAHGLDFEVDVAPVEEAALGGDFFELAADANGAAIAEMADDGTRAELGGVVDGVLRGFDGGGSDGSAGVGELVAVRGRNYEASGCG
jgi:hypothetical protein